MSGLDLTCDHVEGLSALQLTTLLRRLLILEITRFSIPRRSVDVSLRINVSDGGEDGRVEWAGGPPSTGFLPCRLVQFQCKAGSLSPKEWKQELQESSGHIKPAIDQSLLAGGAYIGFTTQPLTAKTKANRIVAIRSAFSDAGRPYASTATVEMYDANKIANWSSTYLSAVAYVREAAGRPISYALFTADRWRLSFPQLSRFRFVETEELSDAIALIRKELLMPGNVLRIAGLSGLGKTRLVYEAIMGSNDANEQALREGLIYVNDSTHAEAMLIELAHSMQVEEASCVLVVDECPLDLHVRLQQIVTRQPTYMSLLTLDYENDTASGTNYVRLQPVASTVIRDMLEQAHPELKATPGAADRIAQFAAGFPKMAELLADAELGPEHKPAALDDDFILHRIVWGRKNEDAGTLRTLRVLSIFEDLGAYDEADQELRWVAGNLCDVTFAVAYGLVQEYVQRGILQKRGRFVRMIPEPLAIRLAVEWWTRNPKDTLVQILQSDIPRRLSDAMATRLSRLDFLPEAQDFVSYLCGRDGPFGQAEGLLTTDGSMLFRHIAEVNPVIAANTLHRILVVEGRAGSHAEHTRRNLVWTLEKLVFPNETFEQAALALYELAINETETWANNATNTFQRLYSLYLPGTEASYGERIALASSIVAAQGPSEVLAKALGRAYETGPFTRTGGVEVMGSGPARRDWRPSSDAEIAEYWDSVTTLLIEFAQRGDTVADASLEALSRGLFTMATYKHFEVGLRIVDAANQMELYWPSGLHALENILNREQEQIDEETRQHAATWYSSLVPSRLRDQLRYLVTQASWNRYSKADDEYRDEGYDEAMRFAEECSARVDQVIEQLDVLLEGEQRHTFDFARRLARSSGRTVDLLDATMDFLRACKDGCNATFLAGLLAYARESNEERIFSATLRALISEHSLIGYAPSVLRFVAPPIETLHALLEAVGRGAVDLNQMRLLAFGRSLDHLEHTELAAFARRLAGIQEAAVGISIEILFLHQHPMGTNSDPIVTEAMIQILVENDWTAASRQRGDIDTYHLHETVKAGVAAGLVDADRADTISRRILNSADAIYMDRYAAETVALLLSHQQEATWNVISDILLSNDALKSYQVQSFLRGGIATEATSLLDKLPLEFVLRWAAQHPEDGPVVIARTATALIATEDGSQLSELTRGILDEYGGRKEVIAALSANLGTFSSVGTAIPHFEAEKQALAPLKSHPIPELRAWVSDYLVWLDEQIERERTEAEEREIH